jgi:hypothetical protein
VEWIRLAEEKEKWWVVVNMIMDLWLPKTSEKFLTF